MKKSAIKKTALITASVSIVLVIALFVHVYMVTHNGTSKTPQRVMARIDLKQNIGQDDADKITAWLYAQKGVDHVLCNADSRIAVFTYSPTLNNADKIVATFKDVTGYKAERYMPDEKAMTNGCPVAMGSWSSKLYSLFD